MFSFTIRPGLELKLIEERHVDEIYALVDRNREYLNTWLPWAGATKGPDQTREFVQSALQQFANNNGFQAGIWVDGAFAGGVGFHKIDWTNRKTEIGYWISHELQGRGFVTSACQAMLDHAFRELKLNRAELRCATANAGSNAVASRLGFHLEGTLRQGHLLHGVFHDLNIYGLLAQDYLRPLADPLANEFHAFPMHEAAP